MEGWLSTLAIVFSLLLVAILVTWLADRWGGDD
jgi:uncharacterized membrane protein AbrB (regulator of aidB expression)